MRPFLRPLSILVFAGLAAVSIATSLVMHQTVDDQEHRLLDRRAAEGSVFLSSLFDRTASNLTLLGLVADMTSDDPAMFNAAATRTLGRSAGTAAVARIEDERIEIVAAAGSGLQPGALLGGERAALVRRALDAEGMVAERIDEGGRSFLGFALAQGEVGSRVLYREVPFDPTERLTGGEDSPFGELEGALYAARTADSDSLVITTSSKLPIDGGHVHRRSVAIGADEWTLVVRARHPLVGSFARSMPWGLLGAGLVVASLITALVEVGSRRRGYALALVDERTKELEEARRAAETANHSKSEFLSRMSHELRTPLNAVLGFAQLLELDDLTEAQHESVDQILRGGRHLLTLINEVLDITGIESGHLAISLEPVPVDELLVDVVDLTSPLATEQRITLLRDDPGAARGEYVRADVQRLKQILLNLVSNAIKYNRPGGTVTLSYDRPVPDALRVRVADTGPGIAPEHRDLLFTPFERLGAEQTGVEGTGIGLALSLRLAHAMGATLDVETTLGVGSTFSVLLPLADKPAEHVALGRESTSSLRPREGDAQPRRKIVYIEDNLSNLRLVEAILREDEIDVIPAMQGRLGVALAREHQPSLVLLDLHLPDMGGQEALRQLRDDPATAAIPVVVVSADATTGRAEQLLAAGADAYVTKPLDVSRLRLLADRIGGAL